MFCNVSGGQGAKTHGHKHCLVMDEVDGMAGNEDRGGIQVNNGMDDMVCIETYFKHYYETGNLFEGRSP